VDARVQLEEDAEGVSAKSVHEDLELVIGTRATTKHTLLLDQEITVRPLDSPARGAATRLLLGDALHEYALTRSRLSLFSEDQACGITAPLTTNPQKSRLP
jgi:hypothetical protein